MLSRWESCSVVKCGSRASRKSNCGRRRHTAIDTSQLGKYASRATATNIAECRFDFILSALTLYVNKVFSIVGAYDMVLLCIRAKILAEDNSRLVRYISTFSTIFYNFLLFQRQSTLPYQASMIHTRQQHSYQSHGLCFVLSSWKRAIFFTSCW
jgi:hypothetical protein